MSGRARRFPIGAALACGLLLVTVSSGGSGNGGTPPSAKVLGEQLISGPCAANNFCITSPTSGPVLYSGATPSPFPLTIANNYNVSITVTSLTVTITSTLPAGCAAATNFKVNGTFFSTGPTPQVTWAVSQSVPANTSALVSPTPTLQLVDTGQNQQACKGITLSFHYSGSARYTVSTSVNPFTASPNPASVGQTVNLSATVNSTITPSTAGSTPVGSVNFRECTNPTCTTFVSLGSGTVNGSGVATATTSFAAVGSYKLYAAFAPTDSTNFSPSTSATITQVVNSATHSTSSTLGSSLNPSLYGQTVTFTDTVTPAPVPAGQSVTFYDGATSIGTGTLNASGKATLATSTLTVGTHPISAVYAGNGTYLTSTSNTVNELVNYTSCITGNQNSNLTVLSGQAICVTSTGRVNGTATVNSGGFLYLNGGTINSGVTVNAGGSFYMTGGTVNGGITLQSPGATFVMNGGTVNGNVSSAGAKKLQICGALNINGTVSASGTTSFVLIGDAGDDGSPACAANKINGSVTLTNNTAGVEVGADTISGNLTLTGNTGAGAGAENAKPEVEANKVNGNLGCTTNTPAPINDGKANTVNGSRTGQCAGF